MLATLPVLATEDPPGCSFQNGGQGNTSAGGLNFDKSIAHVGDTILVSPNLGMVSNACRAVNVTGTVYVASGPLTNFLENVTLNPGQLVTCPANALCRPGPYSFVITPALVGAPVATPLGTANGIPKLVRAVETGFGTVQTGDDPDQLSDFHTASIFVLQPCIKVFKTCELPPGKNCFLPEAPVRFRGWVTNCGDLTLTNVMVIDNRAGLMQLFNPTNGQQLTGNVTLPVGAYAVFTNSFLPSLVEECTGLATNTVTAIGRDTSDQGGPNASVTNSYTDVCAICPSTKPDIAMQCEASLIEPGGLLTYSGSVSNTANVTLTNVTVVSDQPAPGTPVVGPFTLAVGAVLHFTNSYTVPADSCGPYATTLTVQGTTPCGVIFSNSANATCSSTNSPAIAVIKHCPAGLVEPGQTLTVSGTVTNTGNITLTNVMVTNTIAALGNASRLVLGPVSLAPGATANFSDSYIVPLDSCGPYSDTVVASGADKCFGRVVTHSNTQACPGTNSPSLVVTKACPPTPVEPGQTLTVTGTVTNTGNITLTNVVVTNTIAALANESRRVFGPVTLAPGAGAAFSDSYTVPLDSCGPYSDTLAASGADKCFGRVVAHSNTQACPGTNSPSLVVTKTCPPAPVEPGQTMTVTGTVTNTGNITLTNVVVTNTIAALSESRRVFGPVTLAPGAGAAFNDSYTVPLDSCGPYADTFSASGADQCFGRIVSHSDSKSCTGTNSPSLVVAKACPAAPVEPGQTMTVTGTVTNTGNITLLNVVVTNTIAALGNDSRRVFGPVSLAPGQGAAFSDSYTVPLDSCGPYADTFVASGADKCFGHVVTHSDTRACPGTNSPSLEVIKSCPAEPVQPGQLMTVTGTVTNTGNITLTNVVVTNTIAALGDLSRQVLGPITLAPGEGANFTDSYTVPPDSCGPYADTFTASGADKCFGRVVTHSNSKACAGTNTPGIAVTKSCPLALLQPGQLLTVTGTVTNTGNITLTNVVVTNTIAALGNASHLVIGPINLAPGTGTSFSDAYVVPLDSCGPYTDTFTASGADKCFGQVVTHSDSRSCPGTNSPLIRVQKFCPAVPPAPGELAVISGVVSNAGNISLTNVVVTDNQPAENTVVLGPTVLAPGQVAFFTNSFVVPPNFCIYVDTLRASGRDKCFGRTVSHSSSAVCPTATTPMISVTRDCPPVPVPLGQLQAFSGIVSNAGNITLTNVTVVNDQPVPNTPVFGPITLAPGQQASFTGSFQIPLDLCETNVSDTVTAHGVSICNGAQVTASQTRDCPVLPQPLLIVTTGCPLNPVPPGALLTSSGTISNGGTITLTNVLVVSDHPTNKTPVFGPVTLAPGQSTNFTHSYQVCVDCCPPFVDMFTATGDQICDGEPINAFASASCPGVTSPHVALQVVCPLATALGELIFYSGTVSNSGDVLTSVTIADNHSGVLLEVPALATTETADFFGVYLATNCGPDTATFVTATAADLCSGLLVTNQISTGCFVLCPTIKQPVLVNMRFGGGQFSFDFDTEPSRTYTVQYTDELVPSNWQTLTSFVGAGGTVTITDPAAQAQRCYRVKVQ